MLSGILSLWGARGAQFVGAIALTAALVRFVPTEYAGIWFTLLANISLLGLLDVGVSAVMTRRLAIAMGGAERSAHDSRVRPHFLVLWTCSKGWAVLRSALVVLVGLGLGAISSVLLWGPEHASYAWVLWGLLVLSQASSALFMHYASLAQASGRVGQFARISAMVDLVVLTVQIGLLIWAGSLLTVAIVESIKPIAKRVFVVRLVKDLTPPKAGMHRSRLNRLIKAWLSKGVRIAMTSTGTFLLNRGALYVVGASLGMSSVVSTQVSLQLAIASTQLTLVPALVLGLQASQQWGRREIESLRAQVIKSSRLVGMLYMIVSISLYYALDSVIFLWLGAEFPTPRSIVLGLLIFFCVESIHVALVTKIRATEREVFWRQYLSSGALFILLTIALSPHLGIVCIGYCMLVSQIIFTYPTVWRELRDRFSLTMKSVLKEWLKGVLLGVLQGGLIISLALSAKYVLQTSFTHLVNFAFVGIACTLACAIGTYITENRATSGNG